MDPSNRKLKFQTILFRIGLAIAKRLANDGAKVMISSRKEKNVQKALETLYASGISNSNVKGVVCHVGSQTDREKLIDTTVSNFGGIDMLVSNAATNPVMGSILDVSKANSSNLTYLRCDHNFLRQLNQTH